MVQSTLKMILYFHDWLDRVSTMMKTRYDNYVTDCIDTENETKLLWLIGPCDIYDENQIGQWCDRLYRFNLHWNSN